MHSCGPVGDGDLAPQTERVFVNPGTTLAAAGAPFADVAKLKAYVVGRTLDKMQLFGEGVARASQHAESDLVRPITLVGVAALAEPDLLIEVDAVAVLPPTRHPLPAFGATPTGRPGGRYGTPIGLGCYEQITARS